MPKNNTTRFTSRDVSVPENECANTSIALIQKINSNAETFKNPNDNNSDTHNS
jgi:hypothetical protein